MSCNSIKIGIYQKLQKGQSNLLGMASQNFGAKQKGVRLKGECVVVDTYRLSTSTSLRNTENNRLTVDGVEFISLDDMPDFKNDNYGSPDDHSTTER